MHSGWTTLDQHTLFSCLSPSLIFPNVLLTLRPKAEQQGLKINIIYVTRVPLTWLESSSLDGHHFPRLLDTLASSRSVPVFSMATHNIQTSIDPSTSVITSLLYLPGKKDTDQSQQTMSTCLLIFSPYVMTANLQLLSCQTHKFIA